MKIAITVILAAFLVFLGAQIWLFSGRTRAVEQDYADMSQLFNQTKTEQEGLRSDYTYYLNPLNLEKELRARFNYRAPDEKMIIIVPKTTSTKP